MSPQGPQSVRSLDRALAGGLAWAAGAKSATQFFTWTFTLITARLLSPADFGLANMAGMINFIASSLAEFGMGQAVLQMPELEAGTVAQLNTVCTAACTVAYGLLVLAAPLAAMFFKSGQVKALVVVAGLGAGITLTSEPVKTVTVAPAVVRPSAITAGPSMVWSTAWAAAIDAMELLA